MERMRSKDLGFDASANDHLANFPASKSAQLRDNDDMAMLRTIALSLLFCTPIYYLLSLSSSSTTAPVSSTSSHVSLTRSPLHLVIQDARVESLPTSTRANESKRIVAIGDIVRSSFPKLSPVCQGNLTYRCGARKHGDLPHLLRILRFARLVDPQGSWIGGSAELVQTGDIVDRGTDTIRLYRYFTKLRDEARAAGGDIHNLLGNHEIMNAVRGFVLRLHVSTRA